ncbi:MAG: hypothetical protein ACI37R_07465 [Candidatus Avigastranaerophilus sp.]
MKVHPVNINFIEQNIYTKSKDVRNNETKQLSSDAVWNYLTVSGNYNMSFQGKTIAFYAIDNDGNYKKYNSKNKAIQELGTNNALIIECLNGTRKKTAGHALVYADEIESIDEHGNVTIDTNKVKEIVCSSFEEAEKTPVYAVDEKGRYGDFQILKTRQKNFPYLHLMFMLVLTGKFKKGLKIMLL